MNNEKFRVGLPLLVAISIVIGMFLGYQLRDRMPWGNSSSSQAYGSSIEEVLDLLETQYVDTLNTDSLINKTVEELVKNLDPHTQYIPSKEIVEINEDFAGRFVGIGVEFEIFDDTVNILNVIKDGPSELAGLKTGDKIIKVEQQLVAGKKITEDSIKHLLKGMKNTKVNVTVSRLGQLKTYILTRNFVPLYSIDASYMLMPNIGYIRLNKFSETTYEEFMAALEKLQGSGLKDLVLDLRGNGGGMLNEAIDMADEFLGGEKLIVYTQGAHLAKKEFKSRRRGIFEDGKLVVLMDENSASASEVLAGALQDWDRASIVGRRSFGKGLVQEQYNLSDGGALRITVARYYTPLGRCIQKPYDQGNEIYNDEIFNRFHNGSMTQKDTINPKNSKEYTTPNGKKLYSANGIQPDIFIPYDTSAIDLKLAEMYEKNTLSKFIYTYYTNHQQEFNQFNSLDEFDNKFQIEPALYNSLKSFVKKEKLSFPEFNSTEIKKIYDYLKNLFALQIWKNEGYYKVLNAKDPMVLKAIEKIKEH
jgi:carboxyl-terminal processing protease